MNNSIIYSLEELEKPIKKIIDLMPNYSNFAFTGILGAGKTTLISKLLKSCGVTDIISSPTFTYMSVYKNSKDQTFYHFDLYRIKNLQEFFNAGFIDYLYLPDSWAFIEWPEVIYPILDKKTCFINIDYYNTDQRIAKFKFSNN